MKRVAFAVTILLGLAACGDQKAALEADINSTLSNTMTVSEVNMTAEADGNYTGYAKGKSSAGLAAKRNCTATKDGAWNCVPGIDDETLRLVEGNIRTGLADKGEVQTVSMKKGADEDHMEGSASVLIDGEAVAATCTAERKPLKTGTDFAWSCK